MEKPKIEDFQISSHDCWGTTELKIDWVSYAQALEKYIESAQCNFQQNESINKKETEELLMKIMHNECLIKSLELLTIHSEKCWQKGYSLGYFEGIYDTENK